jgi:hypothetical protein
VGKGEPGLVAVTAKLAETAETEAALVRTAGTRVSSSAAPRSCTLQSTPTDPLCWLAPR